MARLNPDEVIISKIATDFPEGFRALFITYYKPLLRIAEKMIGVEFAEDIVQDVFVRVWQQGRFRLPSEELSRYLYRSVLNACRNSIRHELVVSRYVRTSLAELRLGEVEYELRILDEPRNEREDVLRASSCRNAAARFSGYRGTRI